MTSESKLAALAYVDQRRFIVPVYGLAGGECRCGRGSKCGHPGKHPISSLARNGVLNATRSEATIERWWERIPSIENLGIVPGPSGLVVLDVDPRNGGDGSLADLVESGFDLPPTLTSATGGGGWHYVYADPERHARSWKAGKGLDVLAGNSMFVAPPSNHVSGGVYRWVDPEAPVADAPTWLIRGET